ncbi:MAG: transposase family protein [bacterium]|nr:transposase family protein [bacterium]
MPDLALLVNLLQLALKNRTQLALENIALRHQLAVYKRTVKRPRIEDRDRIFWLAVMRMLREWREALVFVKPETVVRWHRQGFRYYWRWKSRAKPGRPPISREVINLIRRLSRENVLWGAPRIRDELALLGHMVAESTVAKYMVKRPRAGDGQSWRTFLDNHMADTAACDFFVVPTLTFKLLYGFVVLSHDRRRILHINVTANPTATWTARQIVEAFPYGAVPKYLVRDRDSIYGFAFRAQCRALGIKEVRIARRSPWQNPFAERLIGSIRRECVDHIVPFNERHLLRTLRAYVEYYNKSRTHMSLDGNAPVARLRSSGVGDVIADPVLGGLHHVYRRTA